MVPGHAVGSLPADRDGSVLVEALQRDGWGGRGEDLVLPCFWIGRASPDEHHSEKDAHEEDGGCADQQLHPTRATFARQGRHLRDRRGERYTAVGARGRGLAHQRTALPAGRQAHRYRVAAAPVRGWLYTRSSAASERRSAAAAERVWLLTRMEKTMRSPAAVVK